MLSKPTLHVKTILESIPSIGIKDINLTKKIQFKSNKVASNQIKTKTLTNFNGYVKMKVK